MCTCSVPSRAEAVSTGAGEREEGQAEDWEERRGTRVGGRAREGGGRKRFPLPADTEVQMECLNAEERDLQR